MDTWCSWLLNGAKFSYMTSRPSSRDDHCRSNNAKAFDDNKEKQCAPQPLSENARIEQYQDFLPNYKNCLP